MRIAGGTHRGRSLKVPQKGVRPTSDKVRQAIFNMLESRDAVRDAIVLDAFCGTGALGLEALSRGAAFCKFYDKSEDSLRVTRKNITATGVEHQSHCQFQDVTKLPTREADEDAYDLVFLDPPYDKGLITAAFDVLKGGNWLGPDCVFVIEMGKTENPSLDGLKLLTEKIYGDTKVVLAQITPE